MQFFSFFFLLEIIFVLSFGHSFRSHMGLSFIGTFIEKKIRALRFQGHLIEIFPIRISSDLTDAEISIPSVFGSPSMFLNKAAITDCPHPRSILAHYSLHIKPTAPTWPMTTPAVLIIELLVIIVITVIVAMSVIAISSTAVIMI